MKKDEISFAKHPNDTIIEVDKDQQEESKRGTQNQLLQPQSYQNIHRMLQRTYEDVDRIIGNVKYDMISTSISKYNYYGKKYRFEQREKMFENLQVTPQDFPDYKTVKMENPKSRKREEAYSQNNSQASDPADSMIPEADLKMHPLNYRLVFDKEHKNTATIQNTKPFPKRQQIMQKKIQKLQKQLNQLKLQRRRDLEQTRSDLRKTTTSFPEKGDKRIKLNKQFFESMRSNDWKK